ncbi:hypothetical protein D3C80_892570 [compost metagenome]
MLADLAAVFRVGHGTFATGVDHCQAAGQPQIRHQLKVIANMHNAVGTLVAEVAGAGAYGQVAIAVFRYPDKFGRTTVGQVLCGAPANSGFALVAEQRVTTQVVQGAADVAVSDFQTVSTFA